MHELRSRHTLLRYRSIITLSAAECGCKRRQEAHPPPIMGCEASGFGIFFRCVNPAIFAAHSLHECARLNKALRHLVTACSVHFQGKRRLQEFNHNYKEYTRTKPPESQCRLLGCRLISHLFFNTTLMLLNERILSVECLF